MRIIVALKFPIFFVLFCGQGVWLYNTYPLLGIVLVVLAVIAVLDVKSRLNELRKIRKIKNMNVEIILKYAKTMRFSRCQRDIILFIAHQYGCYEVVELYYDKLGYRWYHILPDDFLGKVFTLQYWKSFLK